MYLICYSFYLHVVSASMDVKTSFLYSNLEEEISMEQSPRCVVPGWSNCQNNDMKNFAKQFLVLAILLIGGPIDVGERNSTL